MKVELTIDEVLNLKVLYDILISQGIPPTVLYMIYLKQLIDKITKQT